MSICADASGTAVAEGTSSDPVGVGMVGDAVVGAGNVERVDAEAIILLHLQLLVLLLSWTHMQS